MPPKEGSCRATAHVNGASLASVTLAPGPHLRRGRRPPPRNSRCDAIPARRPLHWPVRLDLREREICQLPNVEPRKGVEPLSPAYKAGALPLSYPGMAVATPRHRCVRDVSGCATTALRRTGVPRGYRTCNETPSGTCVRARCSIAMARAASGRVTCQRRQMSGEPSRVVHPTRSARTQ
jgi:hypothetical protein